MSRRKPSPGTIPALLIASIFVLLPYGSGFPATAAGPAAITTNWHTFLGSAPAQPGGQDDDQGYGVAVDGSGYAYVVGQSINGDWGSTPVITHALGLDGFLAQVDGTGALLWHTFIGGSETDAARAVAVDDTGHLVVAGTSNGGVWDTEPIEGHHGSRDAFVARFDASGARQWFTFVGTAGEDFGYTVALDGAGNIFVGGTWVVNPYLAGLDSAGAFQWQRAITSTAGDLGDALDIAVDQYGATCTSPVSPTMASGMAHRHRCARTPAPQATVMPLLPSSMEKIDHLESVCICVICFPILQVGNYVRRKRADP